MLHPADTNYDPHRQGETITPINMALVLRAILKMIVLSLQAMTTSTCALAANRPERAITFVGHGWNHKLVKPLDFRGVCDPITPCTPRC